MNRPVARIGTTRTFQIALASSMKHALHHLIADNHLQDALRHRVQLNHGWVWLPLLAL